MIKFYYYSLMFRKFYNLLIFKTSSSSHTRSRDFLQEGELVSIGNSISFRKKYFFILLIISLL